VVRALKLMARASRMVALRNSTIRNGDEQRAFVNAARSFSSGMWIPSAFLTTSIRARARLLLLVKIEDGRELQVHHSITSCCAGRESKHEVMLRGGPGVPVHPLFFTRAAGARRGIEVVRNADGIHIPLEKLLPR